MICVKVGKLVNIVFAQLVPFNGSGVDTFLKLFSQSFIYKKYFYIPTNKLLYFYFYCKPFNRNHAILITDFIALDQMASKGLMQQSTVTLGLIDPHKWRQKPFRVW